MIESRVFRSTNGFSHRPLNHVVQQKEQISDATHSEKDEWPDDEWPDKDYQEFYRALMRQFNFHRRKAEAGVRSAYILGWMLALLIPMLSTTMTFFSMHLGIPLPSWIVPLVGLLLTFLTTFNAVTKLDDKYSTLAQELIVLNDWKFSLDIETSKLKASKLKTSDKKEDGYKLLKEKNTSLSRIVEGMLPVFTPKQFE